MENEGLTGINQRRVNELTIIASAPKERYKDLLEFLERDYKREDQQLRFETWMKFSHFLIRVIALSIILLLAPNVLPVALPSISSLGNSDWIKSILEKVKSVNR
jgi:hypothetical protein